MQEFLSELASAMNQLVFILFTSTLTKPRLKNTLKCLIGLFCIYSIKYAYVKDLHFPATHIQF